MNKHNAIDVNVNDPSRIHDYNELLKMLTKIYNFDSSSLFTVIEDLNLDDKHDNDLLHKL